VGEKREYFGFFLLMENWPANGAATLVVFATALNI
jgi:hypothetical protein